MDNNIPPSHGYIHPSSLTEDIDSSPSSEKSLLESMAFTLDSTVNAIPSPAELPNHPTPFFEAAPDITISALASAALPPSSIVDSFQRPSLSKQHMQDMRLTPFDAFGAVDRQKLERGRHDGYLQFLEEQSPDSIFIRPLPSRVTFDLPSPDLSPNNSLAGEGISAPLQYVFVTTPTSEMPDGIPYQNTVGGAPSLQNSGEGSAGPQEAPGLETLIGDGSSPLRIPFDNHWLTKVASVILTARQTCLGQENPSQIRVLTHALPAPSRSLSALDTLFPILTAISARKPPFVSHQHAVSGDYNMQDIPTSPASTPVASGETAEYFTTRVFDSAVAVPDYQVQATSQPTQISSETTIQRFASNLQSSTMPRPAATPGTVDISITERYIPPASVSEFINLTDPLHGRSLISDRFVELSEDCGILIFIYITREGGITFQRQYLNALDPVLRSLMVNGVITADDCSRISEMRSVKSLLSFDELKAKLETLCDQVSSLSTDSQLYHRFPTLSGKPVKYEIIHASKEEVELAADVWTEWWIKQEKERVKKELMDAARNLEQEKASRARSQSAASQQQATAATAAVSALGPFSASSTTAGLVASSEGENIGKGSVREVLSAISRLAERKKPEAGIEVGVFVVKKVKLDWNEGEQQE